MFFLRHAGDSVVLAKLVLAVANALANCKLLISSINVVLTLAAHHVFVVAVLVLHFAVHLVGDRLLLEFNRADSTLLLGVLQLFEAFESTLLELNLLVTKGRFSDELPTDLGL